MTDNTNKAPITSGDAVKTLRELLTCFQCWEPTVRVLGNVRADDAAAAITTALAAAEQVQVPSVKLLRDRLNADASFTLPSGAILRGAPALMAALEAENDGLRAAISQRAGAADRIAELEKALDIAIDLQNQAQSDAERAEKELAELRAGAADKPVGVVAHDPVQHGYHLHTYKPWDEIGVGTELYAAPVSATADAAPAGAVAVRNARRGRA